jgi:FkbM family methyltransferase
MNLNDQLVFDIGAHIGTVSEQFHNAGASNIVAVEPCYESFEELRKLPYVQAIHAAVWHEPSIIPTWYSTNQSGWSTVLPAKWTQAYPDAIWGKAQYTPAITLEQLISLFGTPYLIKIDVEGAELNVIKGLTNKTRYLFFEFHQKFIDDAEKCLLLLQRLGYRQAHYTRENIDLETEPTTLIQDFIPRWKADYVEWGNITVS